MVISTVDNLIAGMQPLRMFAKAVGGTTVAGRPHSYWAIAGNPGPGAFDTTLDGVALSGATNGALPFTNPVSGNTYLNRFVGACGVGASSLMLCDRLWHNGGYTITSTSGQNSTTPTWPARDNNGATSGEGVFLGLEISAVTGAGTPTVTISYTNSDGTAGRSATNLDATVASSIAGTFYRIGLQAGDKGVRSVESLTLSATWTSGTMNLVAYRLIAALPLPGSEAPGQLDTLTGGLPRIYDSSVLWLVNVPGGTTSARIHGHVQWAQG